MLMFVVSVSVALFVSFLCSLVEATLLSLTPSQVAEMSGRRPSLGATWHRFKNNIEQPIAIVLILNTAAHTIGASVAGAQFNKLFGSQGIWVFSLAFTYLMLQFTEILPKTMGVRFNREIATVIAQPLSVLVQVLTPLLWLIHWVNRPFERRRKPGEAPATLEEITALAGLARLSNQISSHQERIIRGASRLSQMRVQQVMIPVEYVSFLSASNSIMEAVIAAHTEAHTRFPVCEGENRDRVLGYVNFKEMIYYMRMNPNDPSFRGIIRPVHFAALDASAADLLRVFVDQHVHMAIVRDGDGRTLGLVTFEDLVEELVGELEDEFDRLPRMVHPLTGGTWMVGGGLTMGELRVRIAAAVPDTPGTLSAWLTKRFGRLPKPGEVYREGDVEFTVRRIRRGKIFEVAVTAGKPRTPDAAPPQPAAM